MTGVYVVGADEYPWVKIGIASDVKKRLRQLQTGVPKPLQLFHFEELAPSQVRSVERSAHKQLAADRVNGEWFACAPEKARAAVAEAVLHLDIPPDEPMHGPFERTPAGMRAARISLGWTIAEFAERSHASASTIGALENGKRRTIGCIVTALQRALEDGGAVFLDTGEMKEGGPGVRLRNS